MRSRRKLVIGLSTATLIALVCGGAGFYVLQTTFGNVATFGNNSCDPRNPTDTEALGQFKFPPSIRNLRSWCFGMQGWLGEAQFEMSPSDLDYFVSHLQIGAPLTHAGVPADNSFATMASTMKSFLHGSYHIVYKNTKSFSQDQ